MRLNVKTKINGQDGNIVAKDEFQNTLAHFGRSRIKAIRGTWDSFGGELADNLNQFHTNVRTMSPEQAALKTWTGEQARQAGFGNVTIKTLIPENSAGPFDLVVVEFTP